MEPERAEKGTTRSFSSVLFGPAGTDMPVLAESEPACFADLNLDQIVAGITDEYQVYRLEEFFRTPLTDLETIAYRQGVFRDLENDLVRAEFVRFAAALRNVRTVLETADGVHNDWQRRFWLLEDLHRYQEAVTTLAERLPGLPIASDGLRGFRHYLIRYAQGTGFRSAVDEREAVEAALSTVRYCMRLDGLKVTVTSYNDEPDYTAEVEATFEKFRQGTAKTHLVEFGEDFGLNHVETRILDLVAELNPDAFAMLRACTDEHADFIEPTIARFEREIQFYLAYRAYLRKLTDRGLPTCYPKVNRSKRVRVTGAYDLALAHKLVDEEGSIVTNDILLDGVERILVVTGANHGGKTTFARAFGQLHHLAALGPPVPGRQAELFLPDRILTQFEAEEDPEELHSRLEDELLRLRHTLTQVTGGSIVILNEVFTSTTLDDALRLSTTVLSELIERDAMCVWVTFLDELSTLGATTVSMVAGVNADDPAVRTYAIERRPADGLAHAMAIARKYRVTREQLMERIGT